MEKEKGLIGDFFCGAGGASVGIEEAFGRSVDFAVNHDLTAIKLHSRNHPGTYHMTEDIFTSDVEKFVAGRKVSLLWASPDCTHFSRAKGTPLGNREFVCCRMQSTITQPRSVRR